MSSPSNDIHTDIWELLGTDTLTLEMERVISVMRTYRPRVDIDASYRKRLKNSLLKRWTKKTQYTQSSWFTWMSWVGTSCAAIVVTLGIVRILFPDKIQTLEESSLTMQTVIPQDYSLMDNGDAIVSSLNKATEATPHIPAESRMQDLHIAKTPDIGSREPTILHTNSNISTDTMPVDVDSNLGVMMAMPEGGTMAKMSTTVPTVSDEGMSEPTSSDIIDTEIQDMIWEINAIIRESSSITIPDYPTEMPTYSKDEVFIPGEISLLAGSGITSTLVPTLIPTDLEKIVSERRGSMTLMGIPTVRYISYQKWSQYILVPTVIYTTTAWTTIEVALVSGY